jgi:hypothetical protein
MRQATFEDKLTSNNRDERGTFETQSDKEDLKEEFGEVHDCSNLQTSHQFRNMQREIAETRQRIQE